MHDPLSDRLSLCRQESLPHRCNVDELKCTKHCVRVLRRRCGQRMHMSINPFVCSKANSGTLGNRGFLKVCNTGRLLAGHFTDRKSESMNILLSVECPRV